MKKILLVFGTRPEAIKMAPVFKELEKWKELCRPIVCVTGQHRTMLDQVLSIFNIQPDIDLNVMRPDQTLAGLTAELFVALDRTINETKPEWVVAQGDTTTAFVAAMAAYYRKVPFAHVEAGLRTHNKYSPFPEEINRRIADAVADICFAPTVRARKALLQEGVDGPRILLTGNTVVDALLDIAAREYDWNGGPLRSIPRDRRIVLITSHRRESFGEGIKEICLAIRDLAKKFQADGTLFIYPVHLNPNVQKPVRAILSGLSNVILLDPLDYVSLVHLMKQSNLILTDSGGIQEEAPSFGVPVLVMRDTTERPEGIEAGVAKMVGAQRENIVAAAEELLNDPVKRKSMTGSVNPYGDGLASQRITEALTGK